MIDGRRAVLVVEDHVHAREFVARCFRRDGWDAITAADLPEALAVVSAIGPVLDAVILDLMLPGVAPGQSGVTVCEAMKAAGHPGRVVAWTACDWGSELISDIYNAGVDAILIKPFTDPAEFVAVAEGRHAGHTPPIGWEPRPCSS